MGRLKSKRALITGGTSGIGLETARQFISEAARVAVTGTNPETLEAARRELGSSVLVIKADAADVKGQKVVAETIRRHSGAWTSSSSMQASPFSSLWKHGTKKVLTGSSTSM